MPDNLFSKTNIIAVVGASTHPEKYGYRVFRTILDNGFNVYPINPNATDIAGIKAYPTLSALPKKPDLVIMVVPPPISAKVIEEAKKLGITNIWFQPGSEDDNIAQQCKKLGINCTMKLCYIIDGLKTRFTV